MAAPMVPMKAQYFASFNNPSLFLSHFLLLTRPSRSLSVPLCYKNLRKFRCELDAKGNGALSGDTDPRLIDRQKALEAAMNDINNSFGKGSVTRLGSAGGALVETFPSGCLTLDFALGGGLPRGRIVEIYGPESSGKTTLALHAIAEVQRLGGNAMLVDAEHAFDPAYSRALGVDVENLIVCQPDNGEMALEVADRMCRSGAIDLICVDSVSALTPRAEIEGEIGMQQIGLQARLMSQALRKMSGNASKAGCTLIFLNQIRYKIGVFYGNPEVTSGGIALKFFASVRLEIRPIGKIKSVKGDEDIGVKARVRVQKSKVSRPYKQAEFEIIFGEGVSKLGCVLDCAEMLDIVAKKGSWYSYEDHRLGQGRDKALQFLRENPLICNEVEKAVRSMMLDGVNHVPMIIKGLFRRYQKWNPVHPTLGTFWGMGIGIGCGVGWGPGFGPEVIGYVGAGCGVGFSVGITLVGFGIGLPSNYLIQVSPNAFSPSTDALESRRSDTNASLKTMAEDSWNLIAPSLSFLRNETHRRFSSIRTSIPSKSLSKHIASTFECLEEFKLRCRPRGSGT
ncbi:hypothetical protein J5N97_028369 [Dioscorea zingiberensis]|uniref:Uncharacterized protein n=1 Tax=Dioscorea zingiberensis TaxID=325984 RepID=A0A9D5BYD0_9LILI|nr:hypothetical protein J5N97_028369 [Dioscorea zingiberensis]